MIRAVFFDFDGTVSDAMEVGFENYAVDNTTT